MAKPRLVKVRALFYVLQHVTKRGCAYFDTASLLFSDGYGHLTILTVPNTEPDTRIVPVLPDQELFLKWI